VTAPVSPAGAKATPVAAAFLVTALGAVTGCRTEQTLVTPDPHLNRMVEQEKVLPYGEEPLLPHDMSLQKPPAGTARTDTALGDPLVQSGAASGHEADRIPLRVDRAMVLEGRRSFDTYCAPCHGVLGDGDSVVAEKMVHRKPPSLHEPRIVAEPPGRVFRTIRAGYGLMPSYARSLSPSQAWGVVAYVRALQIARSVPVAQLPPEMRAELAREAP